MNEDRRHLKVKWYHFLGGNIFCLAIIIVWLFSDAALVKPDSVNKHALHNKTSPGGDAVVDASVMRFAAISDYGFSGPNEAAVANLVKSWGPEFIITAGDNNFPHGSSATIDANVGKYYHNYISPYYGIYGSGVGINKFFPALGNHDWEAPFAMPYKLYFTLSGNERYYDYVRGNVHFFVLDSDPNEPDGNTSSSTQGIWLKNKLAASVSKWNIVYFHHSPYASDVVHGNQVWMQWPFKSWGADAVISGNSHIYERIIRSNFPYFVIGLGGQSIYGLSNTPVNGSQVRYNSNFGALQVNAKADTLRFKFYNINGSLIDNYFIVKKVSTDIDSLQAGEDIHVNVYPNPTKSILTFYYCSQKIPEEEVEVKIINSVGLLVYAERLAPVNSCKGTINFGDNFDNGIYILELQIGQKTKSAKFVLSR